MVVAGTAGYCVANLLIPGYDLPWETKSFSYPSNLASSLAVEIRASDGASDYGNKLGNQWCLVLHGLSTKSFPAVSVGDGLKK
jgi:phosphoribosylformylglycinamidine synthase